MDSSKPIKSETQGKKGIGRGILIGLLVIVLLIILIVGLTVFLISPGPAQLERLEEARSIQGTAFPDPTVEGGGAVLEIRQEVITGMATGALDEALSTFTGGESLGVDVRLENDTADVALGVKGRIPGIGWTRRAVVSVRAGIQYTPGGILSVKLEKIRLGRLPIPTGRLIRRMADSPMFNEASQELSAYGIAVDPGEMRFILDPVLFMNDDLPGIEIRHIRAVRGSLRVAMALPVQLNDSLIDLFSTFAAGEPDLMNRLEAAVPEVDAEFLENLSAAYSTFRNVETLQDTVGEEAVVSYLEGKVGGFLPGNDTEIPLDFGDRLPVGSRIVCGRDSYAEILLPGDHISRVGEDSSMVIQGTADAENRSTILSLITGKSRTLVSGLSGGEEFRLEAGEAVMSVRGTDFNVLISRSGTVELQVLDGMVVVNDEVSASADQMVTVEKGLTGKPVVLDKVLRKNIETESPVRSDPEDYSQMAAPNPVALSLPHVMSAASIWANMDEETQWNVQFAVEDHLEARPEMSAAVDEFFRVNNLEDRRAEFESMFE